MLDKPDPTYKPSEKGIRRKYMSEETVTHIQQNGKYRMQIERSATKGIDGFKVEANGDDMTLVEGDALELYAKAKAMTYTEPAK